MNPVIYSVNEIFSQLSPEDEQVLISLPYRVGLYVSFSDITGGWQAQDKENQTLVNILREFSQDFYKTEFMQKVLMDTLASRAQWTIWSRDLQNLPNALSNTMSVLSNVIDGDDLNQFKDVLIDVALSVATAFKENNLDDSDAQSQPSIRQLIAKLIGDKKSGNPFDHANISETEKEALKTIANFMGYKGL